MNQSNQIKKLSQFCDNVGKNILLVQGIGGNVSYKHNDELLIKASGLSLKDALHKNIFVKVSLEKLNANFYQEENMENKNNEFKNLKPSMETLMHGIIKHKFVIHLHAVEAISYLVRNSAEIDLSKKINYTNNYLCIDYKMPGKELATEIFDKTIKEKKKINIFLLKNHGIIISGDSLNEISLDLFKLLQVLKTTPKKSIKIEKDFKKKITKDHYLISDLKLMQLVFDNKLFWCLNNKWNLFPDQTVFLGSRPNTYDSFSQFFENSKKQQDSQELVFIKNEGIYIKKSFDTNKLEQLQCFYEIIIRQKNVEKICTISKKEIEKLLNSKDEKYRKGLNQ